MDDKDDWDWARILYMLTAYLDGPPEGVTTDDLLEEYENLPGETKDYFEKFAEQAKQQEDDK